MRCALTRLILAILGLALLALVATWAYRVPLAAWAIGRAIAEQGLDPAHFVVDEVGLRGFAAHDVSLRGGAIRAAQLTADYDPVELLSAHLHRLTLTGLRISVASGPNGIEVGGKPLGAAKGARRHPLIEGRHHDPAPDLCDRSR